MQFTGIVKSYDADEGVMAAIWADIDGRPDVYARAVFMPSERTLPAASIGQNKSQQSAAVAIAATGGSPAAATTPIARCSSDFVLDLVLVVHENDLGSQGIKEQYPGT